MDKEIKRAIILDNYQNPINKGLKKDDSYILKNTNNESCIDNIDMMMKAENGVIKDILFDGEACAICTSADICMQPNRKKCALLPSNAVEKILEVIRNEKK